MVTRGTLISGTPHFSWEEQLAAHAHLVQFLLRTARRVARVAIAGNPDAGGTETGSTRAMSIT